MSGFSAVPAGRGGSTPTTPPWWLFPAVGVVLGSFVLAQDYLPHAVGTASAVGVVSLLLLAGRTRETPMVPAGPWGIAWFGGAVVTLVLAVWAAAVHWHAPWGPPVAAFAVVLAFAAGALAPVRPRALSPR